MRRLAFLLIATLAVALGGCATAAPPALEVSIVQSRDDRGARIVGISVENLGDETVRLVSAELLTPQFAEPARWEKGTDLRPGTTVALRVPLGHAVCPLPADAEPRVRVVVETSGTTQEITVTPEQPAEVLAAVAGEDCLAAGLSRHATVTATALRTGAPGEPATLALTIEPTGAAGTLDILAVSSTVLFAIEDAGALVQRRPLALHIDADSPADTLEVRLVPNRCDPHAVAEDKRGTFLPLEIATSEGDAGTVYVAVDDGIRGALYAFVGTYCGTNEG